VTALHFFAESATICGLPFGTTVLFAAGAFMAIPTIQLLILDVDGVLTDGGIIRDDAGQQIKRFHVRDGAGIVLWRRLNKDVAIITGKESAVVSHRAEELGIEHVYQNVGNKLDVYDQLKDELGIADAQIAYIGDDLPDLPVMRRVAVPIAVADASEEVRAVAKYVTKYPGGYGAVRDGIEFLCKEMGVWQQVLDRYL
jgi:3-deoxy-D-manno-octulosonate 8-phosphate phosphatase (KDO 8-P phosphatase)